MRCDRHFDSPEPDGCFPCAETRGWIRRHEIEALDKEVARLRAALKAIADGEGADEQSFDWPEFYASVKKQARTALALDWAVLSNGTPKEGT